MVAGLGCVQKEFGLKFQACAYPSRMQRMLSELVGNRKLYVINKAMGGSTTGGYLPSLPIVMKELGSRPSAIFIDYSVNDAREVCIYSLLCVFFSPFHSFFHFPLFKSFKIGLVQ